MADQTRRLQREIKRLQKNLKKAFNSKSFQTIALKEVEGLMKVRVFERGRDSDRNQIGKYSTRPILVGASSFRTPDKADSFFSKKREWRRVNTKKGKRNLAIAPGGYKQVRQVSGLNSSYVDLEFHSNLRKSIQIGTSGKNNVLGFLDDKNRIKAEANEERFNTEIFGLSTQELASIDTNAVRFLDKILNQTFKG